MSGLMFFADAIVGGIVGVMAKRAIGYDQFPHEVCDCYAHAERLREEGDAE